MQRARRAASIFWTPTARSTRKTHSRADGPLIRMTPIAPAPGGVAIATICPCQLGGRGSRRAHAFLSARASGFCGLTPRSRYFCWAIWNTFESVQYNTSPDGR